MEGAENVDTSFDFRTDAGGRPEQRRLTIAADGRLVGVSGQEPAVTGAGVGALVPWRTRESYRYRASTRIT
jgi:hypothetical protein